MRGDAIATIVYVANWRAILAHRGTGSCSRPRRRCSTRGASPSRSSSTCCGRRSSVACSGGAAVRCVPSWRSPRRSPSPAPSGWSCATTRTTPRAGTWARTRASGVAGRRLPGRAGCSGEARRAPTAAAVASRRRRSGPAARSSSWVDPGRRQHLAALPRRAPAVRTVRRRRHRRGRPFRPGTGEPGARHPAAGRPRASSPTACTCGTGP